jgi:hypothetical protein
MSETDPQPVAVTRFPHPVPEAGPLSGEWHVIPWSEVRDGDLALMDDAVTPVEEVRVFLDAWGDGTAFIRADVTILRACGVASGEHKGDTLTCVFRAPDDSPPPQTEAWVAWLQDEGVPGGDRCNCRLSRYAPHPRTPEHGHREGPPS